MVTFEDVKRFMRATCENEVTHVPGMEICVYHKHKQVFRYRCGYRDLESGEPMRGDETFYMYSCTKFLTCVTALTLYEKGVFLLFDPVGKYIPEWNEVKVLTESGELVPTVRPVTVYDLFTMTGGLSYRLDSEAIEEERKNTQGRCPTAEIAKAFAKEPLISQPGEKWNYSMSHDILAALVEVWSGKKFSECVKEAVFEPLGMTRSYFELTEQVKRTMAKQYRQEENDYVSKAIGFVNEYRLGSEYESGGAGLISCIDDMMKLAEGVLSHKILSKATVDFMRVPRLGKEQRENYDAMRGKSDYNYGLGVRVHTGNSSGSETLCELGEFGWDGAAGSYIGIFPEDETCIVYVQHQRMQQGNKERESILSMLICALEYEGIVVKNGKKGAKNG